MFTEFIIKKVKSDEFTENLNMVRMKHHIMHSMLFDGGVGVDGIWKISFRNRRKENYVLKITDLETSRKEKVSNLGYRLLL